MSVPTALITGVAGQDGVFLAEFLVGLGWRVHGLVRPGRGGAAREVCPEWVVVHEADLLDQAALQAVLEQVGPGYVFHLAARSNVGESWASPVEYGLVDGVGTATLLAACLAWQSASGREVSVVNASSSEIFSGGRVSPQDESTPVVPSSPYGAAKAYGHHLVGVLRTRGLKASNAIMYNHESTRRAERFVSRKISRAVAEIWAGQREFLELGTVDGVRDWGWAPDVVRALWLIATHPVAGDFVVATGKGHTVREFLAAAFAHVGIEDWTPYVRFDPGLRRPVEGVAQVGDPGKARRELGWVPSLSFTETVAAMVDHDCLQLTGKKP